MIERKAYICEYCNIHRPMSKKVYLTQNSAYYHERSCYYNPDMQTCLTCKHNYYEQGVNKCEKNVQKKYATWGEEHRELITRCVEWVVDSGEESEEDV